MSQINTNGAGDGKWVFMTETCLLRGPAGSYVSCQPAELGSQDSLADGSGGRGHQLSRSEAGTVQSIMPPPNQCWASPERPNPPQGAPRAKCFKNNYRNRQKSRRRSNVGHKTEAYDSNYTVSASTPTKHGNSRGGQASSMRIPRTANEAIGGTSIRTLFPHTKNFSEEKIEEQKNICKRYRDELYQDHHDPRKEITYDPIVNTQSLDLEDIKWIEQDAQAAENRQQKLTSSQRRHDSSNAEEDEHDEEISGDTNSGSSTPN